MQSAAAPTLSSGLQAFVKSWGMILLSEIGDKTFFIAAIMAMKNKRRTVYPCGPEVSRGMLSKWK